MTRPSLLLFSAIWLSGWSLSALGADQAADPPRPRYERAVLIRVEGPIMPLVEHFVYRKLDAAKKKDADLVILEIDSPGGTVESSLNIAHRLRDLDWADTATFVPRQALSGAAIVALGCDRIIMHPAALLGDAGPIILGEDSLFRHAPEKIRSHLAAEIRDLAEAKDRPPALAEAMVNMDLVVYKVKHHETGQETFMSDAEIQASEKPEVWEKGPPVLESREGHFLEVNGQRAVELGLAEGTAKDRAELRAALGLADHPVILQSTAVDTAVFVLNLPLVTGFLFVVGLIALYIEFSSPGLSIGGLISFLCFLLFFWSRFLGGTAELLEVILFMAGVIFLAAEVFVIPGFGVAGVTGLLLMLAGIVMAGQTHLVPRTERELQSLATSLLVIACSGAAFFMASLMLSRHFGSLPVLNRLMLRPASPGAGGGAKQAGNKPASTEAQREGGTAAAASSQTAEQTLGVGDWGFAVSALRPAGRAKFGRRIVDVLTDGSFVDRGRQVRIVEIEGSRVVVRDVEDV